MKKIKNILPVIAISLMLFACKSDTDSPAGKQPTTTDAAVNISGQEAVQDDVSMKDIVKIAVGSPDHTTLVAALKQAELVTALSNVGPFTVFAPTNAAFDKLPKGTVEGLMKDNKKADLQNILQYHVAVAVFKTENINDGQVLGMVNGDNVSFSVKDGKVMINNAATIVASVGASNGIVHIIDAVLLPPAKK